MTIQNLWHTAKAVLRGKFIGNSLAVQWLGLCAFTAEGPGSISGQGTKIPQAMQHSQKIKKREVHSDKSLSQETEKSQINNLTLHLKQLEKEQTKPKVSRRKEIIKISTEINEIETKKQ